MIGKLSLIKRDKIKWIALSVVLLVAGLFIFWPKSVYTRVTINSQQIKARVVDTDDARNKGLGGREFLAEDEGMLFVFDEPDYYIFWMKDMLIPIDIVYLEKYNIVELVKNMPPPKLGESPAVHKPLNRADMVLEVSAGLSEKYGWEIGDSVEITNYPWASI